MASARVRLSGLKLKNLRNQLGLSIRDVSAATRKVAAINNDGRYKVSAAQLADAENHGQKLGMHKICALSVVYRRPVLEILSILGIDAYKGQNYQDCFCVTLTHPVDLPLPPAGVEAPLQIAPDFNLQSTSLLNDHVTNWGIIPYEFLSRSLFDKYLFVCIGRDDNLLYPYLRPGTIVKVDTRERNLRSKMWPNEFERPIYLVRTSSGWRCSWCNQEGGDLVLVPHPLSQKRHETYRLRRNAEVVGQVVGGWYSLNSLPKN